MKLRHTYAPIDSILEKMGVRELVNDQGFSQWRKLEIQLSQEGVEVPLEEIVTAADKTLEYKGTKVLVYIRDQYFNKNKIWEYKFHIADCKKLIEMKEAKKYAAKYVVSTRNDGLFIVNLVDGKQVIEKDKLVEIRVCKWCLSLLGYHGYPKDKETVYRKFSIAKFFEEYGGTKISVEPRHTDVSAPINIYSDYQRIFSRICRERAQWCCEAEDCGIDLSEPEGHKFLHAHHKNGDKSDNSWENLQALCVGCHFMQPGHSLTKSHLQEFLRYKLLRDKLIRQ